MKTKLSFETAKKRAKKKSINLTKSQYNRAINGRGITLESTRKQTGKSSLRYDGQKKALPPGYRLSQTGHIYYESRKNRSDRRKLKSGWV